jgi:two-component system CheB/CheR fusion protein
MPDENSPPEIEDKCKDDLRALLEKIYQERGYDFREYKTASVERRIKKRLFEQHLETYDQYSALLDLNPGEYSKLFDTLLINVSEFFRDPEAWGVIEEKIIPKILAKKSKGDSIRVWSAGCSTGEEPYSFAILLADKLGDAISDYNIRIYATDIDDKALAEARTGQYAIGKLKNVREEFLDKYFIKENGFYKIHRNIRQMVAFGRQDIVSDAPISRLDIVICRNLLIYFNSDLQNRVITKFHYALYDHGYAFFGKSESMLAGSRLFESVNKTWRIFEKIEGPQSAIASGEMRTSYMRDKLKKA